MNERTTRDQFYNKFLNRKVKIVYNVADKTLWIYRGKVLDINSELVVIDDFKEGLINLQIDKISTITELEE